MTTSSKVDINQVVKDLYFILSNLTKNKEAIQVVTLTQGWESLLNLKDEEWETFSQMDISLRPAFEKAMDNEVFLDEIKLKFKN